jgi:hypothetical protein
MRFVQAVIKIDISAKVEFKQRCAQGGVEIRVEKKLKK